MPYIFTFCRFLDSVLTIHKISRLYIVLHYKYHARLPQNTYLEKSLNFIKKQSRKRLCFYVFLIYTVINTAQSWAFSSISAPFSARLPVQISFILRAFPRISDGRSSVLRTAFKTRLFLL